MLGRLPEVDTTIIPGNTKAIMLLLWPLEGCCSPILMHDDKYEDIILIQSWTAALYR